MPQLKHEKCSSSPFLKETQSAIRVSSMMSNNSHCIEFDAGKIDAIFAEFDQSHLPGAAVGIAIGGKPVYRKGFGLANMELPVALSPSTRMRIFSTSKHFTCLAYMLLCEEGKARVDDPVGKYLSLHPVAQQATIRQLMTNTSGVRDALEIIWHFSGTRALVSSSDVLSLYRDMESLNIPHGTAWIYNNGGFQILSAVVEHISGQSLDEVLRTRIFEPIGMYDTMLRRLDSDFVPNSAASHSRAPTAHCFEKSNMGTVQIGEGGIVSTVDDMLRWLAHMDEPRIGSAETWERMKTPEVLVNGSSTGYGLGLLSGSYRGVEVLYHGGGGEGGSSQMLKVPGAGLDIMIMVNRRDASSSELAAQILDACLPGLKPVRKPFNGPFISGTFFSPTTGRVIQLRTPQEREHLVQKGQQSVGVDGVDMPYEPDDDGVLRPAGATFQAWKRALTLIGDRKSPRSIHFSDFGNLDELMSVQPVDRPDVGKVAGRYRSETTGTEVTIHDTADGPRLSAVGRFGAVQFSMECLGSNIWRSRGINTALAWGGILVFDDAGFHYSAMRTLNLTFRRCG